MGNKSKKPSEDLVGNKWRKYHGRNPERLNPRVGWQGMQPETLSRGGFVIDQIIGRFRKVTRAPLKVRDAGR